MMLPNFVIAGTARSGTTSIYYYLKQHPEICFPEKKEPKYFSSLGQKFPHCGPGDQNVDRLMVRDFKAYKNLFDCCTGCFRIGEASSDYLYFHHHSAAEMRRMLGDVPIIICLRDPVERAWSAYNNLVRDQRETLSFSLALALEAKRLEDNWDWMWGYRTAGLYADQLATFLNTFSQVKVILFEDLKADANAVVREVFAFLGVDDSVAVDTSTRYSLSGKARNRLIAFLSNRDNPLVFTFRQVALKLFPRSLLEQLASRSLEKEDMDEEIRRELRDYFAEDIDRLEKMLGCSLEVWK